jgi:hypothetical protein
MAMHAAVAAGAPLGRFTLGGRFPGRLPPAWRDMTVVQMTLLALMAGAVLARAGVKVTPLFWPAMALTLLLLAANAANAAGPSGPERLRWTTGLAVMGLAAVGVGLTT